MKRLIVSFVAAFIVLTLVSQTIPENAKNYIERFSGIAVDEMKRSGVPASITLAQGILESSYGESRLSVEGNNHFGIMCHSSWKGKSISHFDDGKTRCFRKYDSPEQSYRDHSDFLRFNDRYASLFELDITDYKGWAYGLKAAGYASDPNYAPKLVSLIERYALHEYDSTPVELPETPAQLEQVRAVTSNGHEVFRFNLFREMYSQNGVPFVYALEGETYETLAADYKLFRKEILRFNDLEGTPELIPGTVVYLRAKKKCAAKGLDKHVVAEGETLRGISQRFGIRLKSLYRLNGFEKNHVIRPGDIIDLR